MGAASGSSLCVVRRWKSAGGSALFLPLLCFRVTPSFRTFPDDSEVQLYLRRLFIKDSNQRYGELGPLLLLACWARVFRAILSFCRKMGGGRAGERSQTPDRAPWAPL